MLIILASIYNKWADNQLNVNILTSRITIETLVKALIYW